LFEGAALRALIKLGGTLAEDVELLRDLAGQIVAAQAAGIKLFVVHGGGRQLTRALERRGIESRFSGGLRVTGDEAMQTVAEVLGGSVNTQIVAAIRREGGSAVGLTGVDARITTATQLSRELGAVGRIIGLDPELLHLLSNNGYIPVIACLAGDDNGALYNVNADQMASACAAAVQADHLVFLTDVPGVRDATGNWAGQLDIAAVAELIATGVATGGMQAKLNAAAAALESAVPTVTIAAGAPGVLAKIFAGSAAGTTLVRSRSTS
jgi:acetylglutamate kinase